MKCASLIFGIVLFAVIMKEKIVFSGLTKAFTSKNFSLGPLITSPEKFQDVTKSN